MVVVFDCLFVVCFVCVLFCFPQMERAMTTLIYYFQDCYDAAYKINGQGFGVT